jgi:hypothetical protein
MLSSSSELRRITVGESDGYPTRFGHRGPSRRRRRPARTAWDYYRFAGAIPCSWEPRPLGRSRERADRRWLLPLGDAVCATHRHHAGGRQPAVAEFLGVSRTTVSNATTGPISSAPRCASACSPRRDQLGYTGPRPSGALAAARQGRIARARLRRPVALQLRRPRRGPLPLRRAAGCEEQGTGLALVPQLPKGAAELVRSALVDGYVMFCTPENDERLEAVRLRPRRLLALRRRPAGEHRRPRARCAPWPSIWSTSATGASGSSGPTRWLIPYSCAGSREGT